MDRSLPSPAMVDNIQNKRNCFPPTWPLYWILSSWTPLSVTVSNIQLLLFLYLINFLNQKPKYPLSFWWWWCLVTKSCLIPATPGTIATKLLCLGFPGKKDGVGFHFLLRGTFLNQRSNLPLFHGVRPRIRAFVPRRKNRATQ